MSSSSNESKSAFKPTSFWVAYQKSIQELQKLANGTHAAASVLSQTRITPSHQEDMLLNQQPLDLRFSNAAGPKKAAFDIKSLLSTPTHPPTQPTIPTLPTPLYPLNMPYR